jgi:predicted RNase H-like nuclease
MRVLGVDACRKGWVGVALDDDGRVEAAVAARFGDLVAKVADAAVVAVDMPVGLSDTGVRAADILARRALGRRWASVFVTPIRVAVEAATYGEANAHNRSVTGSGISRQAWNLTAKVLEVERWRLESGRSAWEVHPEVVFRELAGRPLDTAKKTWAGQHQRRALLFGGGVLVPDDLGPAGQLAGPDDVLDAAAVAWTARRIGAGEARSLPDPPESDHLGRPMAIWV